MDSVQTFTADSMHKALTLVRQSLGADAFILSQENQGGLVTIKASVTEMQIPEPIQEVPEPPELVPELILPEPASTADLVFPWAGKTLPELTGAFRVLGASGVGKTSLIIKWLVEWVMHNGPDGALVVATDHHRLGANEPLQLTCQLLGVELVETAEITPRTVVRRDKRLTLIDSCAAELEFHSPVAGVQELTVLSALHSLCALDSQLEVLKQAQPGFLALTHVDQPFASKELLGWLRESNLQPVLTGSSAYVPGGLDVAEEANFAKLMGE